MMEFTSNETQKRAIESAKGPVIGQRGPRRRLSLDAQTVVVLLFSALSGVEPPQSSSF